MEFTDVGAHCYYDLCRQHTYLPFECRYCKHQFCKNHIHSTKHQCPNASTIDLMIDNNDPPQADFKDDDSNNGLSMYKCSYSQCNKQSPISILCKDCNQLFCIKHRYPDDHHCGRDLTLNNNGKYDEDGYEHINVDFGTDPSNKQQVTRQLSDSQYETIRMQSGDVNSFGVPASPEVINVYKFNELRKMGYNDKEVYNAWYHLKGLYPSLTSDHPQFMNKILDTLQSQQKMANYPQQTFDDEKISDDDDNIDGYPDLNRELSKCHDDEEFDVDQECEKLHNVIGIFTTNKNKAISKETAFAQLICCTNLQQRQAVKEQYKKKYMVNLDHYISMNFKGIFKRMILYAMSTDIERQEYLLRVGLKKMDDINVIIQVLCNLESDDIGKLIEFHDKAMFRKSLKSQVRKLTTDNLKLRAFLINIMDGSRPKTESMNGNTSKRDAMINDDVSFLSEKLSQVHWDKDDQNRFIDIFSKRSFEYLGVLCQEYEKVNDISLIDACDNSLGNEYGIGFIINCILMNIMDKHRYYQKLWKKGMKTEGHKYIMFWRVIIDRMDIDLDEILKINGKSDVDRYDFKHFIDTRLHQQDSAAADLITKICKLS